MLLKVYINNTTQLSNQKGFATCLKDLELVE